MRSGNSSLSPPLFDSDLDDVPERGLLSDSSALYLELTADSSSIPLLLALRYEGLEVLGAKFSKNVQKITKRNVCFCSLVIFMLKMYLYIIFLFVCFLFSSF